MSEFKNDLSVIIPFYWQFAGLLTYISHSVVTVSVFSCG